MASPYRYEERILKAASEHFALHGFYGARVDNIAEEAKLNKRMVYEYNHTKEGLYLAVLSRVSRDVIALFDEKLPSVETVGDLKLALTTTFSLLAESPVFVRLWAWEAMDETIHGPRILETVSEIFSRLRGRIDICARQGKCHHLDDLACEHVIALFHGYLLSLAICLSKLQREQESAETESQEKETANTEELSRFSERLQVIRELQTTILNLVYQKLGLEA